MNENGPGVVQHSDRLAPAATSQSGPQSLAHDLRQQWLGVLDSVDSGKGEPMIKPPFDRFRLTVVLLGAFLASMAVTQAAGGASQNLVPATFNRPIADSLGFQWDVTDQGTIRYGTNRCFQMAGQLLVNGSSASPTQRLMTADGTQYVLSWTRSGVQITRRVRADAKTATLRYVESFHNPRTTPVNLDVKVVTALSGSVDSVLTDTGRLVSSGGSSQIIVPGPASSPFRSSSGMGVPVLGDKDCGLVVTRSSSSYPSVLFYLAGGRSKLKPTLARQGSNQFLFSYPLVVPPQETVSIVHGLAQRNVSRTPDAKSLASLFKPFQSRGWTRDLPLEVRRSILNAGRSYYADEASRSPVLEAVTSLADYWDVERGESDVLVQDEETLLSGTVRGGTLTAKTCFGTTSVPLEDAAMLIGGGGLGRPMQVHLRNGEIFVGEVEAKELTLELESGLEVELVPRQINVLFLCADAEDGTPPAEAVALVRTHHGDRLALGADCPSKLRAVTAWGPIEVGWEDIDFLYPVREPQPIHRLVLNDKSCLSVILGGSELELATLRFGPVKLAPGAIARLAGLKAAVQSGEGNTAEEEELQAPHCRLEGGNLMVGSVAAAKLDVVTVAGVTPLDIGRLRLMEREDDHEESADPAFKFELADGTELVGRLRDGVFPFRAVGKEWKVPAYHVQSFRRPEQTEPPPSEATSVGEEQESVSEAEEAEPGTPVGRSGDASARPPSKPPVDFPKISSPRE